MVISATGAPATVTVAVAVMMVIVYYDND